MLKRLLAGLSAAAVFVLLVSCGSGGSPPDAPTELKATPGDSQVTLEWTGPADATWWVYYGPDPGITVDNWTSISGSKFLLNAKSPQVVSGLTNGTLYGFVVNGRNGDSKGGAASPTVTAVPRMAGNSWSLGSPIGTDTLLGTGRSGTLFYATGPKGALYTSSDAKAWTAATIPATADLGAVAFLNSRLYVLGSAGTLVSTTNDADWTVTTTGTGNRLNGIAAIATTISTVGDGGAILVSTTGVNFEPVSSGTTRALNAVASGATPSGNELVAVGEAGTILTSFDGVNWAAQSSGTTATLRGVAFGNSTFVAVGDSGTVLTSTDGIAWTARSSGTTSALNAVVFGSQFVAVGAGGTIVASTDGASWTAAASGTTADLRAVNFGQGTYVAVGANGVVTTSR